MTTRTASHRQAIRAGCVSRPRAATAHFACIATLRLRWQPPVVHAVRACDGCHGRQSYHVLMRARGAELPAHGTGCGL